MQHLECYRLKPEFLAEGQASHVVYVPVNGLASVEDPSRWSFIGLARHPNVRQLADVAATGRCDRPLSSSNAERARVLYV